MTFTHREQLHSESGSFAVIAKNVYVAFGGRGHLLLFRKSVHSFTEITIFGSKLVTSLFGCLHHSLFKRVCKLVVSSFQQQAHVTHCLLVLLRSAQALNARAQ